MVCAVLCARARVESLMYIFIYIAHNVYDNEAGTVIIIGTRAAILAEVECTEVNELQIWTNTHILLQNV